MLIYARTSEDSLSHSYNGLDDRVATARTPSGGGNADIRRFVTAPDGRAMGEYGSSASDVRAEFIWLNPTAAQGGGTTLNWVHADHMGTPIVITDASGIAIAQPGGYTTPAFPSQSRTLTDLYYNRYRDYDPTTGRYIQADPIGLAGGQSPYSYAMGNPLRYMDPAGLHTGTRPWGIPVPVYGPSERDTQAARQLGDALGGLRDWICRHSLICQYFNPPAEQRYCPPSSPPTLYEKSGQNGRYGGGIGSSYPGDETGDPCRQEWDDARRICLQKGTYGPKLIKCMMGYISRRCGGNRPDYEHDGYAPNNIRPPNWKPDLNE